MGITDGHMLAPVLLRHTRRALEGDKDSEYGQFPYDMVGNQSCCNNGVIVICAKKGLKQMKKQVR
jgi:hypothetical protein